MLTTSALLISVIFNREWNYCFYIVSDFSYATNDWEDQEPKDLLNTWWPERRPEKRGAENWGRVLTRKAEVADLHRQTGDVLSFTASRPVKIVQHELRLRSVLLVWASSCLLVLDSSSTLSLHTRYLKWLCTPFILPMLPGLFDEFLLSSTEAGVTSSTSEVFLLGLHSRWRMIYTL